HGYYLVPVGSSLEQHGTHHRQLHTAAPGDMDRIAESFRTGREKLPPSWLLDGFANLSVVETGATRGKPHVGLDSDEMEASKEKVVEGGESPAT
ncbi:hypothetical protein HN51_027246, partial [Arachis hypogaea]